MKEMTYAFIIWRERRIILSRTCLTLDLRAFYDFLSIEKSSKKEKWWWSMQRDEKVHNKITYESIKFYQVLSISKPQ